jgi:TonB family protein
VNKTRPSERLVRSLALLLCLLLYAGGGTAGYFWGRGQSEEDVTSIHVNAVNLSFAQMELVAVEEPSPPKEPEPLPPEEVDIALEEIIEEPEPDLSAEALAKEEPIEADALMSQEASSADDEVTADALSDWVLEQIQKEKYYPPSAQRAGYEGVFDLLVIIEADGTISDASITYGRGHPLLRRSLEKMLKKLPGRNFGKPLGQTVEMEVEFEFELQ